MQRVRPFSVGAPPYDIVTDGISLASTAMTDDQLSITTWEPSDDQLRAAQFRASGYSQLRTAEHCKLGHRTVARYDSDPDFHILVLRLRTEIMRNLEPKLGALMDSAVEVLMEAMAGRLAGDDPRVLLARDISRDTAFRLLRARVAEQLARGNYAPAIQTA